MKYLFILFSLFVSCAYAQGNPCTFITARISNNYVFPITLHYSHMGYVGSVVDIVVEEFDSPTIDVETACIHLPPGPYEFFVTAEDALNRISDHSNHLNYTVYDSAIWPAAPGQIGARTEYGGQDE